MFCERFGTVFFMQIYLQFATRIYDSRLYLMLFFFLEEYLFYFYTAHLTAHDFYSRNDVIFMISRR